MRELQGRWGASHTGGESAGRRGRKVNVAVGQDTVSMLFSASLA